MVKRIDTWAEMERRVLNLETAVARLAVNDAGERHARETRRRWEAAQPRGALGWFRIFWAGRNAPARDD